MMMGKISIPESLREKLRKLSELAEVGIDGERMAAKNRLLKLLRDNNLTIDDISSEVKELRWLKVRRGPQAKQLMIQFYFMVTGESRCEFREYRSELGFVITKSQAAEMETYYSVLAPALKKEIEKSIDIAASAFI